MEKNFEQRLNELNEMVALLQDENTPFEESVEIYEKCLKLSEELKNELEQATARVKRVSEEQEEDF